MRWVIGVQLDEALWAAVERGEVESIFESLYFRFGPPWRYWAYHVGLELGRRIRLERSRPPEWMGL